MRFKPCELSKIGLTQSRPSRALRLAIATLLLTENPRNMGLNSSSPSIRMFIVSLFKTQHTANALLFLSLLVPLIPFRRDTF